MKTLKKTIATILMAAMLVSVMQQTTTTVLAKSKVHSTLKKGTLTISGKGKMPSSMTFQKNRKIKKVVIKSGVTSISNKAFYKCSKLTKVTIAKSVKEIGIDSFNGTALKTATVPSKVKTIGQDAFSNCKNLKNITLPGYFYIKAKSGDSKKYIIANNTFDTVKFNSDFDGYVASYFKCNNLQVADNDAYSRSVDGVVYSNDYKRIVAVPSERTSLVINNKCQVLNLDSMTYATQTATGYTGGCTKLSKITIPESVNKIEISPNSDLSYSCLPLTDIDFQVKNLDEESIISLVSVIHSSGASNVMKKIDEKLEEVTQKDGLCIVGNTAIKYIGSQQKVIIPDGITVIGDFCFADNKVLTEITIPKAIKTIGRRAFKNCTNLSSVKRPESEEVDCLNYVDSEAFMNTGSIDNIYIDANTMGKDMFADSKIKRAELGPNANYISEGMFRNCSELEQVIVGDTIDWIGSHAFENCTKVDISNICGTPYNIGEGAFKGCKWDKIIINFVDVTIEKDAFKTNDDVKKNIIITNSNDAENVNTNAFPYKNTILTFKDGIYEAFCGANILKVKKQKKGKEKVTLAWAKVVDISGYQVKVSTDSKFKKKVSTFNYKSSKTSATVVVKNNNKKVYVKIRPYKTSKGKKVYGRWSYASK